MPDPFDAVCFLFKTPTLAQASACAPLLSEKNSLILIKVMGSLYSGTDAQSLRFCRLLFPNALPRDFLRALLIPFFSRANAGAFSPRPCLGLHQSKNKKHRGNNPTMIRKFNRGVDGIDSG